MEWKLERTARRRVRSEEAMLWENVMRVLAKDLKQQRNQGSPEMFDSVTTPYSNFKSNLVKRQSTEVPVASSPITTRWQQSQARDWAAHSFGDGLSTPDLPESAGTVLQITPEKDTLTPESYKEPLKMPVKESSETNDFALHFHKAPHAPDRGGKENIASKGQKCLNHLFSTQKVFQQISGTMQRCDESQCVWKGCKDGVSDEFFDLKRFSDINYPIYQPEVKIHLSGLRNDYYLNILDWSFQNLVAIALGSAVNIWNGENQNGIENIDLSLTCNYISSVSWMKEGTCLAVGTSEGEVQLWDVVTKKRLRNMLGHVSVVGALSWNHSVLSSGSRLGRVYHHDVRVAQHHVGTLCHRQAVCALKWSPDGRLLSSGCSDGLLTIWPHDPGANAQGQPLKVIPQSTAVKGTVASAFGQGPTELLWLQTPGASAYLSASFLEPTFSRADLPVLLFKTLKALDWCPWQSTVLAIGGGMKDGCLHILDINTGKSIQTPSTNSQICSLIWLPRTKEIATGHGTPKNDVTLWACSTLSRSGGFFGHRGRVLHLALSPDQTRVFSAAADGTASAWKCYQSPSHS